MAATDPYQAGGQVTDVGARVANIDWYSFLGVSGAVTVTGIIVDIYGRRVKQAGSGTPAPSFTASIPAASTTQVGVDLIALVAMRFSDYPDMAGAIINLSGNVYVDINDTGLEDQDFTVNNSRYPILNSGNGIKLGRVC